MEQVGDLPASEGEDDEDEDDEEEEEDENDEVDANDDQPTDASPSAPLDEAAISARIEALRLSKALGNDDPADIEYDEQEMYSDSSDEESDSDESDGGQSIAAQTDYTAYIRAPRPPKERLTSKKLGQKDEVALRVEKEMKGRTSAGSGGGAKKVGKGKGHKWKTSDKYLVGKDNSGW